MDTAPALCRERNAGRDRPVPAPVLTAQLRKVAELASESAADSAAEGWDRVVQVVQHRADAGRAGSFRSRTSLQRAQIRRARR